VEFRRILTKRRLIRWIALLSLAAGLLAVAAYFYVQRICLEPWQFFVQVEQLEKAGTDQNSAQTLGVVLTILGRDDEVRHFDFHPQVDYPRSTVAAEDLNLSVVPNAMPRSPTAAIPANSLASTRPTHNWDRPRAFDFKFSVVGYDYRFTTHEEREEYAATRLAELFANNAKTKLLVHAGYSHVLKDETGLAKRWLASLLWEKTGIEPFTILQKSRTDRRHSTRPSDVTRRRRPGCSLGPREG
jgi:hypothetical protein